MLDSIYTVGKPVFCAFGSSTMMSIAILEYCKHKHGQVRGFCTIFNDVDKEYQV